MKKFIVLLIMFSFAPLANAQVLTADDMTYIKTTRQIRGLEKQLETKLEERRVAVSALETTFQADIDAIQTQINQAEAVLEAL